MYHGAGDRLWVSKLRMDQGARRDRVAGSRGEKDMAWNFDDLTAGSGGAPPVASPCKLASHVFEAQGTQHVFYRAADQRIVELWWRGGEAPRWRHLNKTGSVAATAPVEPASHVCDA